MKGRFAAFCMAVVLFSASVSHGQVTTGTISGTITDSSGAVLPNVSVSIQNEDTGIARTVQTDASGRYGAPSLSLGRYRITATLQGFQTEARTGIVLTVGREAVVDLRLSVGTVAETLEVTGEAPLVQTTESTVSYLVSDTAIRDLPLNGRDLTQLVLLQPGVTQSQNANTSTAFDGFGKRVSISGLRGEENAYLLDGSYINEFHDHVPAGPSGALLGAETVREFQVLTNSFGAQYGRALGGVFNAVSKSGTNEWHGDAYEFLRNSDLDARNFFDRQSFPTDPRLPPFRRNQFGATVGGPIRHDKTFFFLAYEGTRESLTTTKFANVPDADARRGVLPVRDAAGNLTGTRTVPVSSKVAPYLPFFPLPSAQGRNFGDGTAQYIFAAGQPTTENFGLARIDHQISSSDSLFARFTGSNSSRTQVQGYPGFAVTLFLGAELFTVSETHIFSPRALNTVRFAFNRVYPGDLGTYPSFPANLLSVPNQPPPGLITSGLTTFEGFSHPFDYFITNRFNYQDDFNLTLGAHSLQFGGMFERFQLNENQPNRPFGEWNFASLEAFLAATPNRYRGTPPQFGSPYRGMRQSFFALYLQDDWRVTPRLTLNLGLRWEPYTVPVEVNGLIANLRHVTDRTTTVGNPFWRGTSAKDMGPRVGFAWSPMAGGKTSVRGGMGLLFMPNDSAVYFIMLTRAPPLYPEFNFPSTGHFPDALAEIAAAQQNSFGTTQGVPFDNFKSPRALHFNLSVQQQLGASTVVSLGYTGTRAKHLISIEDLNIPTAVFNGTSLEFPANAALVNSNFSGITCYCSDANSWYNSMAISLQRRFSKGLQAQVSYTFSKNIDDDAAKEVGSNRKYPNDPRASRGLSIYDLRNVFNASYSYDLPFGGGWKGIAGYLASGWQMTGVVTAQGGQPVTVTAAVPTALSNIQVSTRSPNFVGGFDPGKIVQGGPDQYFNPLAYSLPNGRELGNVGRDSFAGPGLGKWDFGLTKNTALMERLRLQFRAEVFNLLNRANFASPASSVFNGSGGRVGSVGVITSTVGSSRQIQFGLKLIF